MRYLPIALFLLYSSLVFAQSAPPRYNWKVKGITLEQALYDLTEMSGVYISFGNSELPKREGLKYNFRNKTVEEILGTLLTKTGFHYEWFLGQVFIVPDVAPSPLKFTISGYVRDGESGEPLIGATVFNPVLGIGAEANSYGFYSLSLPEGVNEVVCSYIGYQSRLLPVELYSNQPLQLYLQPSVTLEEVLVTAPVLPPASLNSYAGTHPFRGEDMERLPSLNGEADVFRTNYMLPGVHTGADGFGGMSVRGGDVDQNLVLLDGVPVYNATHLVGIFSVFNTSAIRSSQFYKGVVPARFGGRISSVVDIRTKEGNNRHWQGEADLGAASVKAFVEGPLIVGKSSMFLGARRSLIDVYSRPISRSEFAKRNVDGELSYYFSDINAKINYKLGNRDHIYASFYTGGDNYYNIQEIGVQNGDTLTTTRAHQLVNWGNAIGSFRWNRLYSDKLFSNTTLTYSRFFYRTLDEFEKEDKLPLNPLNREYLYFQFNSSNQDVALATDFDYRISASNTLRFGAAAVAHRFLPGGVAYNEIAQTGRLDPDSIRELLEREPQLAEEVDFYVEDEFEWKNKFGGNFGMRVSNLHSNGQWMSFWQPRAQVSYRPNARLLFSLGFGRMIQPVHLLNNSGLGFPRDVWVAATPRIRPSESRQLAGSAAWTSSGGWAISLDGYYKVMKNLVSFQEGVGTHIDALNWQNKTTLGTGWAYGLEALVKKQRGRYTGWIAYTLARSQRQFEEINLGDAYPFRFDRRHSLHITGSVDVTKRFNLSFSWTFGTGVATTLPRTSYQYNQFNLLYTNAPPQFPFVLDVPGGSRKNDIRLPDHHRLDLEASYSWKKRRAHHELSAGAYNLYNQFNPLYYILAERVDKSGRLKPTYIQVALFPITGSLRYRILFDFRRKS